MTHPIIVEALAAARRDDMLRAAAGRSRPDRVVRTRARRRLRAWLGAQLRPTPRPLPPVGVRLDPATRAALCRGAS